MYGRDVFIPMKEEYMLTWGPTRPDFGPTQVREPSEIKVGETYVAHWANHYGQHFSDRWVILIEPQTKYSNFFRLELLSVEVESLDWVREGKSSRKEHVLAFYGVTSLGDQWTRHHWLEDPSKTPTNPELLKAPTTPRLRGRKRNNT